MSDSEQQQIVPSLIDHQTDKSDLTDPETIEADPAVQQTIESDIIDNNSSNDTDDSGNESPQQQQQQQGPIIQDLGPEDEIHEEQGPGQEYQVEEQGEGPAVVQQPSQQAVQQLTAAQGGQAGNVIEYHVHYYGGTVYQGSVIKGDIVGTKAQAKGATIGSIGGSQPSAIGGPEGQAALAWLGEGASGSSQVPAIGGPEQRPALPWHGEGERGALHPGSNQPLALPAPEAQSPSSGNEQLGEIGATVPTGEPEILASIKPKKKSKKRPNRGGSNRDPEPVPTSRSSVERRFIDEETLNANVTPPKVVGIPTASNPEISGAFPLIPPEPSNRRDANGPSVASPKTTGIPTASNPEISEAFPLIPPEPSNRRDVASGARPKTTDQQSRPTAGQIATRDSPLHPERTETVDSRDSQSDRPSVRFSSQHEVEERSFVGEDTDVTIPKAIGSPTSPSPIYDRDFQQAIPFPGRTEHQHRRDVNIQSGARPKTTGAGMRVRYLPEQDETSEDETSEGIDSENELSDIMKDFIKYKKYVSEEKSLFTRKSERRKSRDRKTTHQAPTTSRSRSTGSRRQRNERQFSSTNRVRSKSADARYLSSLDEASESGDCGESIHVIDPAKESDSESELSSIAKDFVAYIKHKTNPKFSRQIKKSYFEDRSFTNNSSQECQVNLDRERDGMNPTDQTQPSGRELRVKKRDTSDKHLQTDDPNYNKEYETSVLKMTEIYKKERDIQTLNKFKSLLPFIEIFWTKILFKMTMAGYNHPSGAPEKLWSNFTDEITCDRGSEITMKPYISKIKDVMKLGEEFISSGKYIHAIVAFYAAAKLHRQSGKGNESVKGIWTCFDRAGFVAEKMQKSVQTANVAQNHVIPIMHEMTDFLKPIHSQSQFAEELENKSKEFVEEKKFISATAALYVAAKLHKETNEGDNSAHGVLSCIEQISLVMVEMIKQKQTKTLSHVISLITEMIDFIGMIEISNYSQFINEIIGKATEFYSEKKFIPSVISFYVAAKLHGLDNKGVQSVIGIGRFFKQIRLVVEKMTKQHSMKKIVIDHVIPLMRELLEIVQTIKGSTHEVRVEKEARCLFNIGLCYGYCDEHQEDANINNSAIILIERQLEEPQTYRIYGSCLNNAGYAYDRMGNIEKAIELYKMSLEAYANAEDFSSDKDKNKEIERTRNNLRIVESKLPK
uniref:uncharacterized protein LOC120334477 n=1 Tax=Styela clava TaxID=7725 RepID=UPI00193AD28D|nr:uncharacterized protein LOC120334477 [Styela clava]